MIDYRYSDMEDITVHWQQMQLAFRQGYVMTFRELYYAPGKYALDSSITHPLFVEKMFPDQYPKDKLVSQLELMRARFHLLDSHPNN